MKSLRIYPSSVNSRYIAEAVDMLRKGELIIYPTDTLYAIACSALNQGAIEKLCRFKNIDSKKQTLSIVCADISQASEYARIDNIAYKLLRTHCPGAYTFILPAATTLPKAFKGRHTVGVRIGICQCHSPCSCRGTGASATHILPTHARPYSSRRRGYSRRTCHALQQRPGRPDD